MGYRYHFYLLNKQEVTQLTANRGNGFLDYSKNQVLCIESCDPIWDIWKLCRPLFKKNSDEYINYEEEYPCVITKARLKEMILAFHREYQEYIIRHSISLPYLKAVPTDKSELFKRCMHLDDNEEDENHAQFEGQFMLQQQFLIHCTEDGFNALTEGSPSRFEQLLEEPYKLTEGRTMYEILVQLIYLYKTFSPSKKLIICGW